MSVVPTDSASINLRLNEQRNMNRVMTWIKLNRLLQDTNNIVLNECMKDLIELFGGNKNLLFFITKNSEIKRLQSMHQIITTETLKYKNKQKTKSTTKIQTKQTNATDLFSRLLPDECISHICGYLNRKNVKHFKETCRQNAIIAMAEMNKITIGVFNLNTLLSHDNELCHFGKQMIKYSRHSSKKRFCSLYDEWYKQYHISEHNQLIFKANMYDKKFELIDSSNQRLLPIKMSKRSTYLICDTRKTVVLDPNKAIKFNPTKHSFKQLEKYNLMILEYFNIGTQATNIAQFILYKKNKVSFNTLLDYIEHQFILLDGCNWYIDLKLMLNQMCYDKNQPKLTIFTHSNYGALILKEVGHENHSIYDTNVNTSVNIMDALKLFPRKTCLTFQLNYNHPWFNKTNKFDETKLECAKRMDKFHNSAAEFCHNIQVIDLKYFGNKSLLKSSIAYYFNSKVNNNNGKNDNNNDKLETIYNYIDKPPKIRLSATSNSTVLRMKISKLFGNIIDPKYIELIEDRYDNTPIKWNAPIGSNSSILYNFVLYDVKSMDNQVLYNVQIFDPINVPHPFRFSDNSRMISIRYKPKFMAKEFVNYIFETIYCSKNHILHFQYKNIMDSFYDQNKLRTSDKIKCILARQNNRYYRRNNVSEFMQFSENETYTQDSHYRYEDFFGGNVDLYMIRMKSYESNRKVKLNIKFISNENEKLSTKTNINEIKNLKYVGLPLTVWINKNDTMKYIIDKYLSETKQFIHFCYRIKVKDKIISIPERKRSEYKPYYEFIKNHSNDFVIFKFKKEDYKTNGKSKCLTKYVDSN